MNLKTSNSIKSHDSLADFYNSEYAQHTIQGNNGFSIFRLEDLHTGTTESPTFRANYYSFILIRTGKGEYSIDDHTFQTKPNTLYFTNPGHLKSFKILERATGIIMTCSESFLKEKLDPNLFEEFSFLLTEIVPPCYLNDSRFQELWLLSEQMIHEKKKTTSLSFKIISSLLMVYLLRIKEFLMQDSSFVAEYDRQSKIVREFQKNLESHFKDLREERETSLFQVQQFAELQHLHPSYFSTLIKTKTGKSANRIIREKTISEAQALLSRTQKPIKNISYQLGFSEPAHFSKFFKKETELTPNQYRKSKK